MSRLTLIFTLLAVVVVVVRVAANGHGQGQPATFECKSDGYFADYERNCVVYYHCDKGQRIGLGCQGGYRFDEKQTRCRPASRVTC